MLKQARPRTIGLLIIGVLLLAPAMPAVAEQTTVAVVHPEVEATPDLAQLRAIYTMRLRHWPDGRPIRVYTLPDQHPVHVRFAERRLRVLPHLLRRTWDRLVYSGTGQAPVEVADEASMRSAISATPGSIGYLSTDGDHEGVRALTQATGGSR